MNKRIFGASGILSLCVFASFLAGCGGSDDNDNANVVGDRFYALRGNNLVVSDTANLDRAQTQAISGLPGGTTISDIDVRPATGAIYALGSDSRIYRLTASFTGGNATATAVGTAAFDPMTTGTNFGWDFNPTVDRIRLIGDDGQNLRLNPDTEGIAGVDTTIDNVSSDIVAVAYTNSVANATSTTLYGIDASNNTLVLIGGLNSTPSPNLGAVTAVGSLGIDVEDTAGFDIAFNGAAYLVTGDRRYQVNLSTGQATEVGTIGGGSVRGLTFAGG
jgi:hypothetical protein